MRVASAFVLAVALVGVAGAGVRAAAEPEPLPLRVELTAPPGCPDGSEFRQEMERRGAATRPVGPGEKASALQVEIVASEGAAGVAARLVWIDDQGKASERRLNAPDCRAAESALALIAALAVARGTATDAVSPTETTETTETAATTASAGTAPPTPMGSSLPLAPVPATATRESPSAQKAREPVVRSGERPLSIAFSATGDAFVSWGASPEAAFGVFALAGVAIGRDAPFGPILLRAGITAIPTQAYAVAGAQASFGMVSAAGEVCPFSIHVLSRAFASPCVLGEFGATNASGPNDENTLSRPWATAGVEARASIQLVGPLFVDAAAAGLATIDRNQFHVGDTLVYATPPIIGRFSLGLGWLVP